MSIRDPQDQFFRYTTLALLLMAMVGALTATILHRLEPNPLPLDLIVPPVTAATLFTLTLALVIKPHWAHRVIKLTLFVIIGALATPAWFYTHEADQVVNRNLIDTLPPITSLPLLVMILVTIFLPMRQAIMTAVISWCLIALPVLLYLFGHSDELWSQRGKEILMAFGPCYLLVLILMPFYRGLQKKMDWLRAEHERMQSFADIDPLTALYNRRAGERILKQCLSDNDKTGVVLFDLDHFKKINDTYGHPAGDTVLREVAQRLGRVIRRDGYVSRWGGEEFLIVVEDMDELAIFAFCERLRQVIGTQDIDPVGKVTASFGGTLMLAQDNSASILERADKALYEAKSSGRNCVVVD